jgi:hypothetical protein
MKMQDIDPENIEQESSENGNNQVPGSENKKKWNFKQFIDGNFFIQSSVKKQTKFILFLVLLCVLYIQNKYRNEALLVDILNTQKEVKELRDKSIIYAAELMSISRESEVIKIVDDKRIGLKELKSPPDRIIVKKRKKDGR